MTTLPEGVGGVTARYLEQIDRALPGRIEGLYLVGSVALGDYRPGVSDIDFVAVTQEPLSDREVEAAAAVHQARDRARPRPEFSGIYVTWDQLRRPAAEAGIVPRWLGGMRTRHAEANPAVWLTVGRYGVTVRGPDPAAIEVALDPHGLRTWCLGNLEAYWRRQVDAGRRLATRRGLATLTDGCVAWMVLGAPRLHYSIATGDVTSKDGAGRYVLERFPERWHRIAREALRLRRGDRGARLYRSRLHRRRDMLAFVAFVLEDAPRVSS